jgi:S1-C subfamily serine protease
MNPIDDPPAPPSRQTRGGPSRRSKPDAAAKDGAEGKDRRESADVVEPNGAVVTTTSDEDAAATRGALVPRNEKSNAVARRGALDQGSDDDGADDDAAGDGPTGSIVAAPALDLEADGADELDGFGEEEWDDDEYVPAVVRTSRRRKRKEWRQTERARRYAARRSVRFPIFTRSVVLWMLLFALVGTAFGGSGAVFWAHFNTEIQQLKEQTSDFDKRSKDAQGELEAMRNQAISDINNQIRPIAPYIAESKTIQLAPVFAPYVWFVHTFDEEGLNSVGSAFPVATDGENTLMVTAFNTVKSASLTPAPPIELSKGDDRLSGTLVAFDADRDLGLISVPRGGMQILEWATDEQQSQALGLRVFPVSGFGGAGASLTSGVISDQNAAGFLHDARIGNHMQGGPIVTADGKVIGVASIAYHPLGFDPGEMHFSIPVNQVCVVLMECGGGARRAKSTGKPPPTTKKDPNKK